MANLLDLLWDLVERPDERDEYVQDPTAYVRSRGQDDLTGEDVITALDVVYDLVPADLAAAIAARAPGAPPAAPDGDDTPFAAALKSLSHLVESVAGHDEVTERPDLGDTSRADSAALADPVAERPQPPVEGRDDVADHRSDAFDMTDLRVDSGSPGAPAPLPNPVEATPFDRSAILSNGASGHEPDLADVLPMAGDGPPAGDGDQPAAGPKRDQVFAFGSGDAQPEVDQPTPAEPDLPPVPAGGFGTGWADSDARPGGDAVPGDAPSTDETSASAMSNEEPEAAAPAPAAPMFKKKSGLSLPTIGVDAADWYDNGDESGESDSDEDNAQD